MAFYGSDIAREALREVNIIGQTSEGNDADLQTAIGLANRLIGSFANEKLYVSGITRSVYDFQATVGTYTIGPSGTFNQALPVSIERWAVIPHPAVTPVVELPSAKPLLWEQWSMEAYKGVAGAYPTQMWWDKRHGSGLQRLLFSPIPDSATPDLVLYQLVPAVSSLDYAVTDYETELQPGMLRVLILGTALELAGGGRYDVEATVEARVRARYDHAVTAVKRRNITTPPVSQNPSFSAIGINLSTRFNIYAGE